MNRYSVSIGQDLSKNMSFSGVTKKNPEQTIHKLWYFIISSKTETFQVGKSIYTTSYFWCSDTANRQDDFIEDISYQEANTRTKAYFTTKIKYS